MGPKECFVGWIWWRKERRLKLTRQPYVFGPSHCNDGIAIPWDRETVALTDFQKSDITQTQSTKCLFRSAVSDRDDTNW